MYTKSNFLLSIVIFYLIFNLNSNIYTRANMFPIEL